MFPRLSPPCQETQSKEKEKKNLKNEEEKLEEEGKSGVKTKEVLGGKRREEGGGLGGGKVEEGGGLGGGGKELTGGLVGEREEERRAEEASFYFWLSSMHSVLIGPGLGRSVTISIISQAAIKASSSINLFKP